jgi:hypothetical protein
MLGAVERHRALAIEHIIKLGGALVVVWLGSINVHRVGPGGGMQRFIFPADEPVPPAAGTALAWCVTFVTNERCAHVRQIVAQRLQCQTKIRLAVRWIRS